MPAYMLVELSCFDPAWVADYRRNVPTMIAERGGRYLALSRAPERLEGDGGIPETIAIVEFPTADLARAFMESEEYRPYARARQAGAETVIYLLEGIPPPAA